MEKIQNCIKEQEQLHKLEEELGIESLSDVLEVYRQYKLITNAKNDKCSLPNGWWYYDEYGDKIHLVGVVEKWAVVENRLMEKTWLESLEFVMNLYKEWIENTKTK